MPKKSSLITAIILIPCTTLSACQGTKWIPSPTTKAETSPTLEEQQKITIQGVSCPESFQEEQIVKKDILISAGDTLKLNLGHNPSMPCSWSAPEIENPEIVTQIDHYTKWPAEGATPMPGAPGEVIWAFEAQIEGQTKISLSCNGLDEAGEEERLEGTFEVQIRVED